jgi:hypothetical protein
MDILLILIGLAALAINTAYFSTLAHDVKKALGLLETQRLNTLASLAFWKLFLPLWLHSIAIVPTVIINIWKKIIELINCQYCSAWWFGFLYTYLYDEKSIITAIAYGGLTIVFVILIEYFMNYER